MIQTLEAKNFKSIKEIQLNCKRINIFIGEPNTGKSNILELLGFFSWGYYGRGDGLPLNSFVRFEKMSDLFYDENVGAGIEIKTDDKILSVRFENGYFFGRIGWREREGPLFRCEHTGQKFFYYSDDYFAKFKFYRFIVRREFPRPETSFLLPPSGENLFALLFTHKELKSLASQIFQPFGLKLVFKPQENKIEVLKQYEDTLILYPYSLTSDTLQRLVFHLAAIDSNQDSVLVFEEPEAHAFPYHTKYLAEVIALDKNNNQYFVSTHNPYFLLSILEKAPKQDVAVFITYLEDYQTKVKLMSEEAIEEIMGMEIDAFFNIDRFLEK